MNAEGDMKETKVLPDINALPRSSDVGEGDALALSSDELHLAQLGYKQGMRL